jgi:division protein CdvB (Snf7/Vps24/ESCRT-III family)
MSFLFGGAPKVTKDPVKDYQRDLRHAVRSMDREDIKAVAQERILLTTLGKLAQEQRVDLCKAKAKELVRLRAHRNRLATMKGHMTTLSQQLSTVQSAKVMQETMAKTTALLKKLNTRMDASSIHKLLLEFERQSTVFSDGQEIVEQTLDGIFETEDEQSITEEAVANVLQEVGLKLELGMSSATRAQSGLDTVELNDLEARLQNLKTQ